MWLYSHRTALCNIQVSKVGLLQLPVYTVISHARLRQKHDLCTADVWFRWLHSFLSERKMTHFKQCCSYIFKIHIAGRIGLSSITSYSLFSSALFTLCHATSKWECWAGVTLNIDTVIKTKWKKQEVCVKINSGLAGFSVDTGGELNC